MSEAEAAAALEEFLRERPAALARVEALVAEDGIDPAALFDGRAEGLTPLWRWAKGHLAPSAPDEPPVAGADAPTWLRYAQGTEPVLSRASVEIVDGLVSALCRAVERGAPAARWRVGHDRTPRYHWENHPVLGSGDHEFDLADLVPGRARTHVLALREVPDDVLSVQASTVVERLAGTVPGEVDDIGDEPLLEVEALGDGTLEVVLADHLAHARSDAVDDVVAALRREPGVRRAEREDRERLVVDAPGWSAERLRDRLVDRLREGRGLSP